MYLVITGNEFGMDINAMIRNNFVPFIPELSEAESQYKNYLEEFGCAAMYKIHQDKLELIKDENTWEE